MRFTLVQARATIAAITPAAIADEPPTRTRPAFEPVVVAAAPAVPVEVVLFEFPGPVEVPAAFPCVPGAFLSNATRLAVKRLVALRSCASPVEPSYLLLYHLIPHSVPLVPPVQDFAAATAEPWSRGRTLEVV